MKLYWSRLGKNVHTVKYVNVKSEITSQGTPNIVNKPEEVRMQAWKRFCLITLRSHQPCWHTFLDFWLLELRNNKFLFLIHPLCSTCYGNLSKLIYGPKSTHLSSTMHDLIFPEHESILRRKETWPYLHCVLKPACPHSSFYLTSPISHKDHWLGSCMFLWPKKSII